MSSLSHSSNAHRRFRLELDPLMLFTKLPSQLYRRFKDEFSSPLMFIDSNSNEFELQLEKGHRCGYIVDGVKQLMDVYGLEFGGWIEGTYNGDSIFTVSIHNHNMQPKQPPFPPLYHALDNNDIMFPPPNPHDFDSDSDDDSDDAAV